MLKTTASQEVKPVEAIEAGPAINGFSLLWLLLAFVALLFGLTTVLPFLTDFAGLGTAPFVMLAGLGLSLLALAGLAGREASLQGPLAGREWAGAGVAILATLVSFLYSMSQAASFQNMPVGITVDAVHHFALADYIKTHAALPLYAGPDERARLVEMVSYPPAFHLGAVWASFVTGKALAYVMFPFAAWLTAISSGLTTALAYTLLRPSPLRPLFALLAAFSAYFAYGFVFDTFMYYDFYGQLAGQVALLLCFYFALHYFQTGYRSSLALGSLAGATLALAYTHWLPMAVFALGLAAVSRQPSAVSRQRLLLIPHPSSLIPLALTLIPIALVAALFVKDRLTGGNAVWTAARNFTTGSDSLAGLWLLLPSLLAIGLFQLFRRIKRKGAKASANDNVAAEASSTFFPFFSSFFFLLSALFTLAGAYVLWRLGSNLAGANLERLYPFEGLIWAMLLPAGAGAALALFKGPATRLYLAFVGGLVLEVIGYVLLSPGGVTNAYHLSKLYALAFTCVLPVLVALPLQVLKVESRTHRATLRAEQEVESRKQSFGPSKKSKVESSQSKITYPRTGGNHLSPNGGKSKMSAIQSALTVLFVTVLVYSQLQANRPNRQHPYAGPGLVEVVRTLGREKIDPAQVQLSVHEGVPAYFAHVGLLDRPRNAEATSLLEGNRASFETWLYSPTARPYLLTDQLDLIEQRSATDSRFEVLYQHDKAALLGRRPGYAQELTERRVLFLRFQGELTADVLTVNLEMAAVPEVFSAVQPVLVVGPLAPTAAPLLTNPLYSRKLPLAQTAAYDLQKGYLKLRFGEGYSRGEMSGLELPPDPMPLEPGQPYSLWVQLWKDGKLFNQRKVQDFEVTGGAKGLVPLMPPATTEPAQAIRTGQLVLEAPRLPAEGLNPTSLFFQQGDQRLIELTGWAIVKEGEGQQQTGVSFKPGDTVKVLQRYLPLADLKENYIAFVRLLDADNVPVAQADLEPAKGLFPTWLWPKGQAVSFEQELKLPDDLPPGAYSIALGFHSGPLQTRLATWLYQPDPTPIWTAQFVAKDAIRVE